MVVHHAKKSNTSQQSNTLDTEHMARIKKYESQRNSLKDIEKDIDKTRVKIAAFEKRGRFTLSDVELENLLQLRDKLKDLESNRDSIESSQEANDYFVDTAAILFKYYDIVENGATANEASLDSGTNPSSILNWFSSSSQDKPKVATTNDRATLLDKYLTSIDPTRSKNSSGPVEPSNACHHCKSTNRTSMINDGYLFCNDCFTIEWILVDHDKPSYKDPPKEITYFAYKRINHFNEWLNTVQGKETTLIPDEMLDKILLELKKLRITNLSTLTNAKMKEILKKLRPEGGSRYYEHIPHIITKLNGLPSPNFPQELEEKLRHMFCQIQVPFLKHACELNPSRKNFLSYSYVLRKMVELLGKDQYSSSFNYLKSREKLHQQDMIWCKICEELGWQYYRSI